MPLLSVFIPVFNEERILKQNILKVYNKCKFFNYSFEIFIVDDNSTDSTPLIAKDLCKKYRNLKHLRYNNGPSRRENLAASFPKANGKYIVFMDADLATDISHLRDMIKLLREGYDVVIGSRYAAGAKIKREITRRIISFIYNYFMWFYFHSQILDHQCGFKGFKRNVALNLIKKAGYDKKFIRGWFWDVEIMLWAQKLGYKIKEIPVRWRYGDATTFILSREFRMLKYLFKLRSRL